MAIAAPLLPLRVETAACPDTAGTAALLVPADPAAEAVWR
jgi:hypothetical protein